MLGMACCIKRTNAATALLFSTRNQLHFFPRPTLLMSSAMAADRRFSYNGLKTFNGYGTKTPFLIGVAGGTASGKVHRDTNKFILFLEIVLSKLFLHSCNHSLQCVVGLWRSSVKMKLTTGNAKLFVLVKTVSIENLILQRALKPLKDFSILITQVCFSLILACMVCI